MGTYSGKGTSAAADEYLHGIAPDHPDTDWEPQSGEVSDAPPSIGDELHLDHTSLRETRGTASALRSTRATASNGQCNTHDDDDHQHDDDGCEDGDREGGERPGEGGGEPSEHGGEPDVSQDD